MKKQTVLVLQGPTGTDKDLAGLAETISAQDGHISVVHVGPIPPIPTYAFGGMPYGAIAVPDEWLESRKAMTTMLEDKQKTTRAYLQKENISGEVAIMCADAATLDDLVAQRAAYCDLAIVQRDLRDQPDALRNLMYGLLFKSPAPVLLNAEKTNTPLTPDNVFVAWNTSLPAARAVHLAMPILKAAKSVTIACFDPIMSEQADGEDPGTDVAKWLSHHGCSVTVQHYSTGGAEVGDAIQLRASEAGADIVVMGAYGHSRLRETMLGGTTRTMIDQTDVAVLLAH